MEFKKKIKLSVIAMIMICGAEGTVRPSKLASFTSKTSSSMLIGEGGNNTLIGEGGKNSLIGEAGKTV